MYFDIEIEDIAEAVQSLGNTYRSHCWSNPIAIAIERRFGPCSCVLTYDMAHIHGNGVIGRFDLTDAAKEYMRGWRNGHALPVRNLHVLHMGALT